MSLTGFDSEVIGFDSVSPDSRPSQSSSSQTTEFGETSAGCQASMSRDVGCGVNPEELVAEEQVLKEYPPPGLNEFLRRVVPSMMEQLDQNDKELLTSSSDSDEEDVLTAKLLQEIKVKPDGSGDHQTSVLDISWSSAGNSIAVSVGRAQHDAWCQDTGVIRVYTLKRSEDRFVHTMDITDKNCVTVLKYHPTVAALLAYGTTSGEVVVCDLRNGDLGEGARLTSAGACHGSRRVSALQWADAPAANAFLTMLVSSKGVRRRAADQVVVTAGCGGSLAAWRVNASARALDEIVGYAVRAAPDITCFDFVKPSPLRPEHERTPEDVFVVGSTTGKLFLCKIRPPQAGEASAAVDPVYDALEGHATCVLGVAFSAQTPGVFASVSMDSELRVYDIAQGAPLKVVWLEVAVSCVCWAWPPCLLVGLCGCEELLRVYHACGARALPVRGLCGRGDVCCLAVQQGGSCRVAAGDDCGTVRVWELPARRVKLSAQDFDF